MIVYMQQCTYDSKLQILYINAHDVATQPSLVQQLDSSQLKSCKKLMFLWEKKRGFLYTGDLLQSDISYILFWTPICFSMGFPWVSHGFPMGFPGPLMALLMGRGCSWSRSFGMIGCWLEAFCSWLAVGKTRALARLMGLWFGTRWCPPSDVCWFINHSKYRYIMIYLP